MTSPGQYGEVNTGVINTGSGNVNIANATGDRSVAMNIAAPRQDTRGPAGQPRRGWDVGVITVLPAETRALLDVLGKIGNCATRIGENGRRFFEADVQVSRRLFSVAATEADNPGETWAMGAFGALQERYQPSIIALAGIAGAVHECLKLGDVVVTREVVHYDSRKETPGKTRYRGHSQPVPVNVLRAINSFFSIHDEPCLVEQPDPDGKVRAFSVWPGPIGSGNAVIASSESEILQFLRNFNDKILAVETEAAGLAHAFYQAGATPPPNGWLSIRGISDKANRHKNDKFHKIASWHAATALTLMLQHLIPDGNG